MNEIKSNPLNLGRGLRIVEVKLVQNTGEIERYDFSRAAATVLKGPRNSSKTTTLQVINYCLGGRRNIAQAISAPVEEKYAAFVVKVSINGHLHELRRESAYGSRGRIFVNDDVNMAAEELSDWLLSRLGWPSLAIPQGTNPATATSLTPLTFRSLIRHIYRREDSWTEFAYKEEEYLRRAVISLFLGFAPSRYESVEYELGRARHGLASAEAVYADVLNSTTDAVEALTAQLGLPPISDPDSLGTVEAELRGRLEAAQTEREDLTTTAAQAAAREDVSDTPGLNSQLPGEFERASAESASAAELVANLSRVVSEYIHSQSLVQADMARLRRLMDATDVFDEVPVKVCPACEQEVDASAHHDERSCYLCRQPVSGDVARRRAEREERALDAELLEIEDALSRTEAELEQARRAGDAASARRTELGRQLHDKRASTLAPFMAALEDVAKDIGHIEQQLASIPAIKTILDRRVLAANAVEAAETEVQRLEGIATNEVRTASMASRRCGIFADMMNDFLRENKAAQWKEGGVTIASEELTFYVGTRPWNEDLGGESRVLFFLAYSYALLSLSLNQSGEVCAPGLLMLDNPYQQGLPARIVHGALNQIAGAAIAYGAQVIVTQPHDQESINAQHDEILMRRVYRS